MRMAAIVAAILVTIATSAFAQEWAEFVSRDDRFTANFPGTPQVTQTTYKSQFGRSAPNCDLFVVCVTFRAHRTSRRPRTHRCAARTCRRASIAPRRGRAGSR